MSTGTLVVGVLGVLWYRNISLTDATLWGTLCSEGSQVVHLDSHCPRLWMAGVDFLYLLSLMQGPTYIQTMHCHLSIMIMGQAMHQLRLGSPLSCCIDSGNVPLCLYVTRSWEASLGFTQCFPCCLSPKSVVGAYWIHFPLSGPKLPYCCLWVKWTDTVQSFYPCLGHRGWEA